MTLDDANTRLSANRPRVATSTVTSPRDRRCLEPRGITSCDRVEPLLCASGHPHVFSDRLIRPGDQAFFDIIHSFMGYRTCYYRTFNVGGVTRSQLDAYQQCREWLDNAIELVRPGATTDQLASVWPTAEELGFPDEQACFGLQFGHGLGVGLYEAPMISRVHSLDHPIEIEEGMVFALETYCAASDGESAARIEEEVVVTENGYRIITKFPAEELLAETRSWAASSHDSLDGTTEQPRGTSSSSIGPAATWGDRPAATGSPVISESGELSRALTPYLGDTN